MSLVWALDLPTGEKIVLLALADQANDNGHCWPSMALIAKRSGMTTRGAQSIIKRLETIGHLHRVQVIGKGCNYYIHPRTSFTPERRSPPKQTALTPERRSPKPSRTISIDRESVRASFDFVLPDSIPAEAWADFLEMRKAKRASPTAKAKQLLVAKLLRLADAGHPPGDVLNQSTEHNWTGIFELKGQTNAGRSRPMGGAGQPLRGNAARSNAIRDLVAEAYANEAENPGESVGDYRGAWAALPGVKH